MRKKSYAELKAEGLCTRCANPNPIGGSLCEGCRKRQSEQRKSNREYRVSIGICTRCGKNKAEPNKRLCMECLGKENDTYYVNGVSAKKKESDKMRKRAYTVARREAGLCYRCGKTKASYGRMCERCRAKARSYRESARCDILRSERPYYGICYICGIDEVVNGKKVCQRCYSKRLETIPAMLAAPNHAYFEQLNYARICMIRANRREKTNGSVVDV